MTETGVFRLFAGVHYLLKKDGVGRTGLLVRKSHVMVLPQRNLLFECFLIEHNYP
jgi:hypothetical protein